MEKEEGSSLDLLSADDASLSGKDNDIRELKHPGSRKQLFACTVCDKVFFSKCSVRSHLEVHRGNRSFVCGICNKVLLSQNDLLEHRRTHTYARPHRCTDCGKTFADKSNLARHQLIHKGDKRFVCGICGKAFLRRCNLSVHQFTHTAEKPYTCEVCGDGFAHKRSLLSHQQEHTETRSVIGSTCMCGADSTSMSPMKSLVKLKQLTCHSSVSANKYTCDICGSIFSEQSSLSNHKQTHAEYEENKISHVDGSHDNPLASAESGDQTCDPNISRMALIQSTQVSHAHICQMCGEPFDTAADLKRHETIHNSKHQLFVCGICGKGFTKLQCLQTHQRIHQKETGHKCNDCGRVFTQKRILLSHQRGHCSQASCMHVHVGNQAFSSPNDLEAHTCSASQNSP